MFKKIGPFQKATPREEVNQLFRQGIDCKNKGEFAQSKQFLEQALAKDPDSQIIKLKLWQVESSLQSKTPNSATPLSNNSGPGNRS